MSDPIGELAVRAGIVPLFHDLRGVEQVTSRETQLALLATLGLDVETETQAADRLAALDMAAEGRVLPEWQVVEAGVPLDLTTARWELTLEDGGTMDGQGALGPLPLGIHVLTVAGHETLLLAAPPALPEPERGWGLTAPIWGLRGRERAGIGDFHDLRVAGEAAARHGAKFLGINPIHAGFPLNTDRPSPYSPSHRRRLNPVYMALGVGVSAGELVDYEAEIPAKFTYLRASYAEFLRDGGSTAFRAYKAEEGEMLRHFAAHQALSARHGPYWTDWPAEDRSPATARLGGLEDEIDFQEWLQWRAHEELTGVQAALLAAGMKYGLYLDLAVGTHPAGAETWGDPASFANGVSLGAPPDPFAPGGQDWGLAPLDPRAMVRGRFRVLAETLRQQLRYSRLLRIDHILGFERAFWVPRGGIPGAYVRMPRDAMLAVVRIEAARAQATVIGEDLGNIPDGLQGALEASGVLGCRVVQFEEDAHGFRAPEGYARHSLASWGTHDLPTYKGWRESRDIAAREAIGQIDGGAAEEARHWRNELVRRFDGAAGGGDTDAMHRFLARAGSALVAVQAEDVLELAEQSNLPGTVDQYPNWRRRLPVAAEALADDPGLARAAALMGEAGR